MNVMQVNLKRPTFDAGLCRCCGATKKCRLLNFEYECLGHKEVYSDMLVDCFGLMLSNLDGEQEERLICATCVTRLRDAAAFRRQVLSCEERLLSTNIQIDATSRNDDMHLEMDIKVETVPTLALDVDHSDIGADDNLPDNDETDKHPTPPGRKSKTLKKDKKLSGTKRTPVKSNKEAKDKKNCLIKIKKLGEELKQLEKLDKNEIDIVPECKPSDGPLGIDNDEKAIFNTMTIVKTSYVCPFDTSFSDYFCIYCRELFTDPDKLRDHTLKHDSTTLKDHIVNKNKKIQIDITRIDCRLCAEKIDCIETLKTHLKNIHKEIIYENITNEFLKFRLTHNLLTCTACGATFKFFHALKKHMAEHFGTCICDICGAHYFEERMLGIHQKTHQKKSPDNFPCKECGKSFKSKHSRDIHVTTIHKKQPAYECYKCDDVLFSYSLRLRHMIEVHGEQRRYPCEHCDRSYDNRKSLREHNRRNHLKIFKHQCDLCDKRFYLPSRLKEHMVVHTGERNFRCEYCGKSYPRMRGLKVHMQTHEIEKKYRCDICHATFSQSCNMKTHMKRQHQATDQAFV